MNINAVDSSADFIADLPSISVTPALVETVEGAITTTTEQRSDLERLQSGLAGVQELQALAKEYGIADIFQDNGGKVLQVLILLGLRTSPGREGNDAVDAEGQEYEIKTLNSSLSTQVTTHHHLNKDILRKYRAVKAWYFAIYKGIELEAIYRVAPSVLEPKLRDWEARLDSGSGPLNNPKIPLGLVKQNRELVYPKHGEE